MDMVEWMAIIACGILVLILFELRRAERELHAEIAETRLAADLAERQAALALRGRPE